MKRKGSIHDIYRENRRASLLYGLGITAAWPMLCGVKYLYPSAISWQEVLIVPLPVFGLPIIVLILNEVGYRYLRWSGAIKPTSVPPKNSDISN